MATPGRRGKSAINWLLLGLILLGLGGWGVTSFSSGNSGAIGSVGSVKITANDYARVLHSDLTALEAQTGQRLDAEAIRAFGLPQAAQQRLITSAALEAHAQNIGLSVGDMRVAEQIRSAPAFQSNGSFSRALYADVLRREDLTEKAFEHDVRMDEARLLIQKAVTGGTTAPAGMVAATTRWLTETRDISWTELSADDLAEPVAEPDDETLTAWWKANSDKFTAPETRHLTYAWLTPEMLAGKEEIDEAVLRDLYADRESEYNQPARRMVERLLFPDTESAEAAKASLDKGEASFDDLVASRGLERADIDLGEVTEAKLGKAAAEVFAADQNGVVGPVQTELGPALFSVNAILDPVKIPFEEARPDLLAEAAADKATRDIAQLSHDISDLLAGGATLEDLTKETHMELGEIDWHKGSPPEAGTIAAYPAFREHAETVAEQDYPELLELDDGGIFALRLDKVTPAAVIPFDEVRTEVLEDWTEAEAHKRLLALADEQKVAAMAGDGPPAAHVATGLGRDGVIEDVPGAVVTKSFALSKPGDNAVVDADGRVFLIELNEIHQADPESERSKQVHEAVQRSLSQSLSQDMFAYYIQALIASEGLKLNPQVATAVEAQLR